jgi:Septum formation
MAIAGIVLGVMWTGLSILFIALGVHAVNYGNLGRVQAGACFNNLQPGQVSTQVHFLSSCSQPHNGQVVGTFALSGQTWPGSPALHREASAGCSAMLSSVLRQHALASGVSALNYTPDKQAWSSGSRSASCVLLDPNARHTGSMFASSGS